MENYTHVCIKPTCGASYSDSDPDRYYCPPCLEEKRALAAQIDAQITARPKRESLTPLQEYEQAEKVNGFMRVSL